MAAMAGREYLVLSAGGACGGACGDDGGASVDGVAVVGGGIYLGRVFGDRFVSFSCLADEGFGCSELPGPAGAGVGR